MLSLIVVPTPARAGDLDTYFTGNDYFGAPRSRGWKSQVYIRIPFGGYKKSTYERVRLGLSFQTDATRFMANRHSYRNFARFSDFRPTLKPFDLSIGLTGRESIQFNGYSLTGKHGLFADSDNNGRKGSVWPWVIGGIAAVAITAIVVTCTGDEDGLLDQNPC